MNASSAITIASSGKVDAFRFLSTTTFLASRGLKFRIYPSPPESEHRRKTGLALSRQPAIWLPFG